MAKFSNKTFGSIGAGNMAEAILRGLVQTEAFSPEAITAADPSLDALAKYAPLHIKTSQENADACKSDIVLLAVKPQILPDVLKSCAADIAAGTLVISIAAGIRTSQIAACLQDGVKIVRVMPNTPLLVGAGASCVAAGPGTDDADVALALEIFGACGNAYRVEESQLDAVTALSGSGPAYVFKFCEALGAAGIACGLPQALATDLARQTLIGAARMLEASDTPPATLRRNVTSPGGTTEAALKQFDADSFDAIIEYALRAAHSRSLALAGEGGSSA